MQLRPACLAIALLFASVGVSAYAEPINNDDVRLPYIVQLHAQPIAAYTGGIPGLPATKPAAGERLDLDSSNAQQYAAYLEEKLLAVQALVAEAPVNYQYKTTLSGFSTMLTAAEVRRLKASGEVSSVTPDQPQAIQTYNTPTSLGLSDNSGLWRAVGGKQHAGEDVIIGVIDSGVWPENPAYADRVDANGTPTFDPAASLAYTAPPARWKGTCQAGEGFTTKECNNKLIGARYFDAAFLGQNYIRHVSEFHSPRDSIAAPFGQGGHGTHVSATAAGNGYAGVSGIAPRARLAAYKVCWTYQRPSGNSDGTCMGADSAAAVEQAVLDGVDVLNFSISGGGTIDDVVAKAFRNAANAGVFVAAAGGNEGPSNLVQHVSPWVTTVAATTHSHGAPSDTQATLRLGDGRVYQGVSVAPSLAQAQFIPAEFAGVYGADITELRLCTGAKDSQSGKPVLDPAKVKGKIVFCVDGKFAQEKKSLAVQEAGGAGMVLMENPSSTFPQSKTHSVPTIYVNSSDGYKIYSYTGSANASATIAPIFTPNSQSTPSVADFSARGPNSHDGNVLKPDISAPGVHIFAAHIPSNITTQAERDAIAAGTPQSQQSWASLQGTSMATPHVAGLAALLRQQYPSWSPAAIKSALMTTATDTQEVSTTTVGASATIQQGDARSNLPFSQGAGQVVPNSASDPGLVYDITQAEYENYVCEMGVGQTNSGQTCAKIPNAGQNLNLPSISINNVRNKQTVKRQVTNVAATQATYHATHVMDGYDIDVAPKSLTLNPGETGAFEVTLTRTDAAANSWKFGTLNWSDGQHTVRSPIAARSLLLESPGWVKLSGPSGSGPMLITNDIGKDITSATADFAEVIRKQVVVTQGYRGQLTKKTIGDTCKNKGEGTHLIPFNVTANTAAVSFATYSRDIASYYNYTPHDIDLAIIDDGGAVYDYRNAPGSEERIVLIDLKPGYYSACIIGYTVPFGITKVIVSASVVNRGVSAGGKLQVKDPAGGYVLGQNTVEVTWSGMDASKRYLGAVQWLDRNKKVVGTTVLTVDP